MNNIPERNCLDFLCCCTEHELVKNQNSQLFFTASYLKLVVHHQLQVTSGVMHHVTKLIQSLHTFHVFGMTWM